MGKLLYINFPGGQMAMEEGLYITPAIYFGCVLITNIEEFVVNRMNWGKKWKFKLLDKTNIAGKSHPKKEGF